MKNVILKRILVTTMFLAIAQISFSQQTTKRLTEEEKVELRKQNGKIYFPNSNSKTKNNQLSFTNTSEQSEKSVQVITVNHYYGKTDSLYKSFAYKPKSD